MDKNQDEKASPLEEEGAGPESAPPANGPIDVDAIIAKVNVPPQVRPMYSKAVLSGMRIMFDKRSHGMMEKELAKPGPMADKIATGIIALIYMLWTQSNRTLPPQIIVPITFVLTLKAFDFLQKSEDPEATKDVLGDAIEKSVRGILEKFGVPPDQVDQIAKQYIASKGGGQPQPTTPPGQPSGMLAEGGEA